MPYFNVLLCKEVAFDATVRVFAKDADAALDAALQAVTADDWEEGDWESGIECAEVEEVDDKDAAVNVYTTDDGSTFTLVPVIDDVEDWKQSYEVDRRDDIPDGAVHCARSEA